MKYYSDGFSINKNPSPIGGGFSIVREDNLLIEFRRIFKENFTNNEAELLGVLEALRIVSKGDTVSTDSKIVILWVFNIGRRKKNARKDLDPLKIEAYILLKRKNINLIWEPRDKNLAGIYNESIDNKEYFGERDEEDISWI